MIMENRCFICKKILDYDYNRHSGIFNLDMVWKEPHQTYPDGTCTLVGYIHPGDVHLMLCDSCGRVLKDELEKADRNEDNFKRNIEKDSSSMNEIVCFELNTRKDYDNYPKEEPFISWMNPETGFKFLDNDWVIKNKLCVKVSTCTYDKDSTFLMLLITAPLTWIKRNCPSLLVEKWSNKFVCKYPTPYFNDYFDYKEEKAWGHSVRKSYPNRDINNFKPSEINGIVSGDYFLDYNEENKGILISHVESSKIEGIEEFMKLEKNRKAITKNEIRNLDYLYDCIVSINKNLFEKGV